MTTFVCFHARLSSWETRHYTVQLAKLKLSRKERARKSWTVVVWLPSGQCAVTFHQYMEKEQESNISIKVVKDPVLLKAFYYFRDVLLSNRVILLSSYNVFNTWHVKQRVAYYGITQPPQKQPLLSCQCSAQVSYRKPLACEARRPCTEILQSILSYLQVLSIIPGSSHFILSPSKKLGPKLMM